MPPINPNYSKKNWELIAEIPQLTGLLMSTAAYSGIEGTKDELKASVKSIAEGRFKYPNNKLITEIVPEGKTLDEVVLHVEQQQKKMISNINIDNENSLKRFQKETINSYITVVNHISKVETGVVLDQFRSWLLNIAEQVAVAAIEGTVFGQKADPFSEEERKVFARIKKNLINKVSY